jgi:hypothetical protein
MFSSFLASLRVTGNTEPLLRRLDVGRNPYSRAVTKTEPSGHGNPFPILAPASSDHELVGVQAGGQNPSRSALGNKVGRPATPLITFSLVGVSRRRCSQPECWGGPQRPRWR